MADAVISFPRLDDQQVVKLIEELAPREGLAAISIRVPGLTRSLKWTPETIQRLSVPGAFRISSAHVSFPGFSITYHRGGQPGSGVRQSAIFDEIQYGNTDPRQQAIPDPQQRQAIPDDDRLAMMAIVDRHTQPNPSAGPRGGAMRFEELDGLYRSTLLRLETAFAEQINKITSWTVEQADAFEKRKLELAQETQAERERINDDYEARLASIKEKEEELEQRRKDLDDRDYMHARRAQHAELRNLIQAREQSFTVTKGTRKLRLPVHMMLFLLIASLAAANIAFWWTFSIADISSSVSALAWAALKQGLLAAALLGAVFYYVRWMTRWFDAHANAEFLLKQFQLDIDRASWAVETALEWRRIENTEVPAPLLEGITRNLFDHGGGGKDKTSAVDDLASALVGNASGIKIKAGDNEITLDRKAISQLDKA